eukprot:CAMPEP_0202961318 /NCGR_PEP_ID=MMETSP1396-20130829/5369_1 /ASSEMBLY_ACC=CAM_ASM_000872 /TAXON_ID= /ORGANISM="Pseudokeronopsis sp., Strain Brazil" /LENGTH=288 /DNA_ID=CAMNT_0049681047 /DNA_START=70 /DNA_END=936 /DNA_ORIENTATION=+
MSDLDSLIGCKISLISHQDIRYDGTLFSINQSESSIVLKDVQVFGTENRITDKSKAVPPSTTIVPFVTYPGAEIKDLFVHESSTPPPAPAAEAPAPRTEKKSQPAKPPAAPTTSASNNQQAHKREERQQKTAASEPAPKRDSAPQKVSEVGTGGHLLKLRERKNGPTSTPAAGPVESGSDFNFEEGLKTFNKEDVLAEVAGEKEIAKYTKDDFFDNFSKSTGGVEAKPRLSAAEERKLNQDTFGAIALQSGYRRGGRGGGRGRGRSGRGRGGRGRGGFQGQSSAAANA